MMRVEEKDVEMVSLIMEEVLAVLVSIVKVVQLVLEVSFDNIPPNHCVPVLYCFSLLANIHASFFIQSTKSLAIMRVEEKDVEMVSMIVGMVMIVMLDVSFNNIAFNIYVPALSCISLIANIHASLFI
jgi:hypothetical protein